MSTQTCEFCNHIFASRTTLKYHQKKNKTCLLIRMKEKEKNDEKAEENGEENDKENDKEKDEEKEQKIEIKLELKIESCKDCDQQINTLKDKLQSLQTRFDTVSTQLVKSMLGMKQMSAFIHSFCKPSDNITNAARV